MTKKKERQNRRKKKLKVKEGRKSDQKHFDQVSECFCLLILSEMPIYNCLSD